MKKTIIAIMLSCISMFIIIKYNHSGIRAYAVSEFNLVVEEIDSDSVINNSKMEILPGDFKVTFHVSGNTGFAIGGVAFPFNNQKLAIVYQKNVHTPACIKYDLLDGLTTTFLVNTAYKGDPHTTCIGMGFIGTHNNQGDGDIISFFLRPIPNMVNSTDSISDLIYSPDIESVSTNQSIPLEYDLSETFEYYDAVSYSFILGNINGDGNITVADAQNILLMLSAYQGVLTTDTETNVFDNDPNFSGLFIEINGVSTLVLQVADVNFDGIIDTTDASLVLQYVAEGVSGTPHPDECQIGLLQNRVLYILCFTN